MERWSKTSRTLYLFEQFLLGETLGKAEMAKLFNSTEKTVQRDIEELRGYCSELQACSKPTHCGDIVYSRSQGGYQMRRAEHQWLSNQDILCIARL